MSPALIVEALCELLAQPARNVGEIVVTPRWIAAEVVVLDDDGRLTISGDEIVTESVCLAWSM